MMTLDEATKSYIAARKLSALYDTYRATSRAQAFVIAKGASVKNFDLLDDEDNRAVRSLRGQMNSAQDTDMVFALRSNQLDRRIRELKEYDPS